MKNPATSGNNYASSAGSTDAAHQGWALHTGSTTVALVLSWTIMSTTRQACEKGGFTHLLYDPSHDTEKESNPFAPGQLFRAWKHGQWVVRADAKRVTVC